MSVWTGALTMVWVCVCVCRWVSLNFFFFFFRRRNLPRCWSFCALIFASGLDCSIYLLGKPELWILPFRCGWGACGRIWFEESWYAVFQGFKISFNIHPANDIFTRLLAHLQVGIWSQPAGLPEWKCLMLDKAKTLKETRATSLMMWPRSSHRWISKQTDTTSRCFNTPFCWGTGEESATTIISLK